MPKSIDWRENILSTLDSDRFRQMLRMERHQFDLLLSLISDDEEFQKPHACKQFSIGLQLAIVLYRLGSSGENASVRKIATTFGVGDGGTLSKITNRVFRALIKQLPKYIFWPNNEERKKIVAETYHELPLCIGYIDGTEIKLAEAPVVDHEAYFSRNHIYSIKAQVVCDNKLRIRDVVVGSPGSSHDAKIFKNCSIFKNKENYVSAHQWIAGDSAYPLSDFLITPFRSNSEQLDSSKRKAFNLRHSRYRVRVEHCFGLLKEKFGSLKELRMRIHNKNSHKMCCKWIIVCCIIHNILLSESDLELGRSFQNEDIGEEEDCPYENNTNKKNSEIKRQGLYYLMFE